MVSGQQFKTLKGSENTKTHGGQIKYMAREGGDSTGKLRARSVVMKTVAYCESVKHIVHQNHRTNPIQGP